MKQHRYVLQIGDGEPVEMQDNLDVAIDKTIAAIRTMPFEPWRRKAVHELLRNMPRAGLTFTDKDGTLVRVERKVMVRG